LLNYEIEESFKLFNTTPYNSFEDLLKSNLYLVTAKYIGTNPKIENIEYKFNLNHKYFITLIRNTGLNIQITKRAIKFLIRDIGKKEILFEF